MPSKRELTCRKSRERMPRGVAGCPHAEEACKFRTDCVIYAADQERRRPQGVTVRRHRAPTKVEPDGRILNIQHSISNVQVRPPRLGLPSYLAIEDWVLSIGYWISDVATHARKTRTSHGRSA